MKNTQAPTDRSSSASNTRSAFFAAAAIATLLITTSCTTSQQVAYSPSTAQLKERTLPEPAPTAQGWHQVSEQPPTFFPVGLSKDAETDYRHGDWVRAGEDGAMWFVPIHGVGNRSEQELRNEALAMVTPGQKVNRALGSALDSAGDLVGAAAEAYSFLAGGEGPGEVISEKSNR
jgi:hypothetical protein